MGNLQVPEKYGALYPAFDTFFLNRYLKFNVLNNCLGKYT